MIATEHKIEIRRLTRKEMYQLLNEASNEEIKYISKFSADQDLDPCEFFENFSHEYLGMVEDGRPVYVATLMKDNDGQYDFWTVANKDINNMISLCKNAKKILNKCIESSSSSIFSNPSHSTHFMLSRLPLGMY